MTNTTVSSNTATKGGGGIFNAPQSNVDMTNTTFSHNQADGGFGGAIYNDSVMTMTHNTLSDNIVNGRFNDTPYGVIDNDGTMYLRNNIVANSTTSGGGNCTSSETLAEDSYNLMEGGGCGVPVSTSDPLLGPLVDNGGDTQTHALLSGSPALDAAVCLAGFTTDQRGQPRPSGGTCDIGSYEAAFDLSIIKTVNPSTAAPDETITYTLTFSNSGSATASGVIITDSIPVSVATSSVISSGVAITQTSSGYVWAVQDLAPTEGGVITITGVLSTSLAEGAFTNTATIGSNSVDSDPANNSDSAGVTIPPSNVGINKTVTPATAAPGETITYTLTFSNSGYATASGIIITDSIPISVTTSSVISSGVAITQTASGYVWAVQDLARNEGGVITITGVLSTSLADGAFTNTATISSTSTDSDTGNNSNSAGVTVGESGGVYLPIIIKN
ncbi:MAG: DUF11 domain-containing protein [Chloroflexi bacterium]|nr:DUF11 domain-containing protein [Chloroflexota bacterium]